MNENQVAVQFVIDDSTDFDSMIHIEDMLKVVFLADASAVVDGHDIGQGRFNIFLLTKASLDSVVDRIKVALDDLGVLKDATIAHRPTSGSGYAVVWPEQHRGTFEL